MTSNRKFELHALILLFIVGGFVNVPLHTHAAQSAKQIASERFVPSADGLTVHDNLLHVAWLADTDCT